MHEKDQIKTPVVYKKLDGNDYELEVFTREPGIKNYVKNLEDGETFEIEEYS